MTETTAPAPQFDTRHSSEFYTFAGKDVPWLNEAVHQQTPDKAFLIWEPKEGEVQTWQLYQQFWQAANQIACGLIKKGVKKRPNGLLSIHARTARK